MCFYFEGGNHPELLAVQLKKICHSEALFDVFSIVNATMFVQYFMFCYFVYLLTVLVLFSLK